MLHIKNWMTLELTIYYSLIIGAILYLLIEFLRPKGCSFLDKIHDEIGDIEGDDDFMDKDHKLSCYFQMIFSLMMASIFVIYHDSGI